MTVQSLIGVQTRLMTLDETHAMMAALTRSELQNEFDQTFADTLGFSGSVLYQRMKAFTTAKITRGVGLFIVITSGGNPGNLVMWVYTLHKMNKDKVITINDFVDAFPHGVPTEEALMKVWDAQKDLNTGNNLIDDPKNWN